MQHVFDKARSLEEAQGNAKQITGTCPSFMPVSSNAAMINATALETKQQCLIIDEKNLVLYAGSATFAKTINMHRNYAQREMQYVTSVKKKGYFAKICQFKRRSIN